jgi:pimeloyl-ACP methyl ester carboxylesterase
MTPQDRTVDVGRGVTLTHQAFGDPADPALVLVAGLGQQLLAWPEAMCGQLAAHGLHVVRFDNRDAGRSTSATTPPPGPLRLLTGRFPRGQYDLSDLARDTAGLIHGLDLAPAHVVGMSMGGMISQTLAAQYPQLVASMTSIMSTTGARRTGRPARTTLRFMLRAAPAEREPAIEQTIEILRHIASAGFPFDEDGVRALAGESFDRGRNPAGTARQLAAIIASGDRTAELRRIAAPTLVIHGDRDLMVHPSGARATAAAIPGARLETIAGLGHDLPVGAHPRLVELIADHVRRAAGDAPGVPADTLAS